MPPDLSSHGGIFYKSLIELVFTISQKQIILKSQFLSFYELICIVIVI